MKLDVMKKALAMYTARGDWGKEEMEDINTCWSELEEMEIAAPDESYCDDVTVLPTMLMFDFGNVMWYNAYGRKARLIGADKMTLDDFVRAIRTEEYFTEVSAVILKDMYDFLSDLWSCNEAEGTNRQDGSFCRYMEDSDFACIQAILDDKLKEPGSIEEHEKIMQAKRRLTALYQDKWTTYCGADTCEGCDGWACRPC